MVSFKIPTSFRKGQDISYEITGNPTAAGDTFKIVDQEGNQVDIIGQYTEDNDFGDKITGTIENAKDSVYQLIAYGSRWVGDPSNPASMTEMWDKELVRFNSNQAQVLPSLETTQDQGGSGTNTQGDSGGNDKLKTLVSQFSDNKVLVAGAIGVGLVVIGEY